MELDKRADLAVSDYSQLGALREFLGWAVPGIRVLLIPARRSPDRGPDVGLDRNELDILALLASRTGLMSAVRILPEFLRSRREALSITITIRGKSVVLTASNVDDVIPILDSLLDSG